MTNKRIIIDKKGQELCFKCKEIILYSEKYDAYYCGGCNIWLSLRCDDLFCTYCRKRPTRPLTKKDNVKKIDKRKGVIKWKI